MTKTADLMTRSPVRVGAETSLRKAARLLYELDVRHLPIVNDDNEVVGMLSDRDLRALSLPLLEDEGVGLDRRELDAAWRSPVSSLMAGDVLTVDAEADVSEAVSLMVEHRVGAVPVTDADGVLVGIVSYVDVLRSFPTTSESA